MAVKINRGRALDAINMTPVIDMVFLLLIFFLVASQFAEEERALKVVLPSASEARPLTQTPREIFVNVDHQGQYFMDGRVMQIDEVEAVLRQAVANNPVGQSVIIRADKRVLFDAVVAVMNACNKVGVRDYVVTTASEGN
ncbi:MAG: biopolymer transporter ExbD [Pirellulales bacterium]